MAYGKRTRSGAVIRRRGTASARAALYRTAVQAIRSQRTQQMLRRWKDGYTKKRGSVARSGTVRRPYKRFYMTRGYTGPKFKKPYKYGVSKYSKRGYIEHVEGGGLANSTNAVYIGHALGVNKMFESVCGAILRRLAEKAGYSVRAMNDLVQPDETAVAISSPFNLEYTYRLSIGSPIAIASLSAAANARWNEVQTQLVNDFYAKVASGGEELILLRIWISPKDNVGEVVQTAAANMDLGSLLLDMNFTSNMTLQNRTVARTGTVDESNRNDVANNPLGGRVYSGRGNGAVMRVANYNNPSVHNFLSDPLTGVILFGVDAGGGQVSVQQKEVFNRPPLKSAFQNVSSSGLVKLNPGQIRKSSCTFVRKMYFSTFVTAMYKNVEAGTGKSFCNLGMFKIYGFEKICNTRADEPDMSVGYEINNIYRCAVTETKKGINVVHTIT